MTVECKLTPYSSGKSSMGSCFKPAPGEGVISAFGSLATNTPSSL